MEKLGVNLRLAIRKKYGCPDSQQFLKTLNNIDFQLINVQ